MSARLSDKWLKAAVAGGIWASFEIIVGSFLHNLHIPFSGTSLASFSVILMIAFVHLWRAPGLIWRAGIICGLMKSLSPSAVILGPMTGIMMEAIMMDLFISLFGLNLLGYLFAGAGALLSTILHKIASLFILYGNDVVTIYINLFEFLRKQFGISQAEPADLIIVIITGYTILGALAAFLGFLAGRSAVSKKLKDPRPPLEIDPFAAKWEQADPGQQFRVVLLFVHVLFIPSMLVLISFTGLSPVSLIPLGIYFAFMLLYYKRIIHRLKKPFFWVQLLIMILAAGIFYHPDDASSGMSENGFLIGVEMSLRAILIITAFSGISVEIRNPRITNSLIRAGLGRGYAAVSLAFNSLPVMLDRSADFRNFIKRPVHSFTILFYEAELWLACYQTHLNK